MKRMILVSTLIALLLPPAVSAHHGSISLALGPGSPIETNSPLTLPEGGIVISTRGEQVAWRQFDFAAPENKSAFTFYNMGLSYGIRPYLTGSLFLPYNIKSQDTLGSIGGAGDIKFLFNLGFNHGAPRGLRLNAPEDTAVAFEESRKSYFSLYGGFTLPTGKSDEAPGGAVDRGMQPGFRSPTFTVGVSAARHIAGRFSLFADASYELFTPQDAFKFGDEVRLNIAGVYGLYGRPEKFLSKIDGVLELNLLNIARDEEEGEKLKATGGTVIYVSPGLRFSFPKLWNANLGILVKLPAWNDLHEKEDQQGAEGLEKYRATVALSFFF